MIEANRHGGKQTQTDARGMPMLVIRWLDDESKDYTDLLPEEWFVAEGEFIGRAHLVRGPKKGESTARCNVKVSGKTAELDYRPYKQHNRSHGNILGVLRLQFADSRRRAVPVVRWRDPASSRFRENLAEVRRERINVVDAEELGVGARRLLNLIVQGIRRGRFVSGKPDTYLGYKEVHDMLGLQREGGTWGRSLQRQGLNALAEWTRNRRLPALTGLIVDTTKRYQPGHGYFAMFNKGREDDHWWRGEIRRALEYDWSTYSRGEQLPSRRELAKSERIYSEGKHGKISLQVRRRCEALRRRARQYYRSPDGELRCASCGWVRPVAYLRSDIVEVHHIRPVSQLALKGVKWTVAEALKSLVPLCPNCHRVVHSRPNGHTYSLEELKKIVVRNNKG